MLDEIYVVEPGWMLEGISFVRTLFCTHQFSLKCRRITSIIDIEFTVEDILKIIAVEVLEIKSQNTSGFLPTIHTSYSISVWQWTNIHLIFNALFIPQDAAAL